MSSYIHYSSPSNAFFIACGKGYASTSDKRGVTCPYCRILISLDPGWSPYEKTVSSTMEDALTANLYLMGQLHDEP